MWLKTRRSFAHNFGGNASLEQQGRVGGSQVVEADAGDSCAANTLPERLGEDVRMDRRSVGLGEDRVGRLDP